jgi:hypothetical protein
MDTNLDHLTAINGTEESLVSVVSPIELITQFLISISEENMVQALQLASEILVYEPDNLMILEYRKSLALLIQETEGDWFDETIGLFYSQCQSHTKSSTEIANSSDDSSESEELSSECSGGDSADEESHCECESESEDCELVDRSDMK